MSTGAKVLRFACGLFAWVIFLLPIVAMIAHAAEVQQVLK